MSKTVSVTNKSTGTVIYSTSFGRRVFNAGMTRSNVPVEELQELVQTPGGDVLLYNYLFIEDNEVLNKNLEIKPEPEYYLKEADIPNWMQTCSLDEFKDALDFAPMGTKDLIKKYAVELPLNDYNKCAAITDQLGFDVVQAIKDRREELAEQEPVKTVTRRTEEPAAASAPQRRTKIIIPNQG